VELARALPHETVPVMKVSRSYEFAAAHRLYTPKLSEADNRLRYDKCANMAGHGHNYQVEVTVQGSPDRESGYVIPPVLLDQIVNEEVYQRFDHKHLNEDCPEFRELVPTSENLAKVIFDLLQPRLREAGYELAKIGLHETQKNYFEVET
jgi:6-pyruvoyltetrahydropterin/6-carboxytetrahydropterin synthase